MGVRKETEPRGWGGERWSHREERREPETPGEKGEWQRRRKITGGGKEGAREAENRKGDGGREKTREKKEKEREEVES
jgi:hypothetical protein